MRVARETKKRSRNNVVSTPYYSFDNHFITPVRSVTGKGSGEHTAGRPAHPDSALHGGKGGQQRLTRSPDIPT